MIYLDNSATTNKKPNSVIRAVIDELKNSANPGRSGHKLSLKSSQRIYETREKLSQLFKTELVDHFILTPNATYALNFVIKGILKPNDHVLTTSMEHNSVLRPLFSLKNVETTYIYGNEYGIVDPIKFQNLLKPNTALFVVNHSSNVNGVVQDIKGISKIAKKNNIPILIDASQTAGIIDINSNEYDYIAMPGHKALYGPQGTGALFINSPDLLTSLIEGGTGSNSKELTTPEFLPDKFESGTLNTAGFYGLSKGIEFIINEGIDNIREYEHFLLNHALNELSNMKNIKIYSPCDVSLLSSCFSFNIENKDSANVSNILNEKYNIAVRGGFHCAYPAHMTLKTENIGAVRVSVSYFNTKKDLNKLIDAVYKESL